MCTETPHILLLQLLQPGLQKWSSCLQGVHGFGEQLQPSAARGAGRIYIRDNAAGFIVPANLQAAVTALGVLLEPYS